MITPVLIFIIIIFKTNRSRSNCLVCEMQNEKMY